MKIQSLNNPTMFAKRREIVWQKSVGYWLKSPLRHVVDVTVQDKKYNLLKDKV
jgi:hypothetical protein